MLQNIKIAVGQETKVVRLTGDIITEVGKIEISVEMSDTDSDGRPKASARNYYMFDTCVTHIDLSAIEDPIGPALVNGLRRLGNSFVDVCDINGWNAYSY